MNLAFPALCILLLVLPGIIYRKAYARGSIPVIPFGEDKGDFPNKFPTSIRPLGEEIAVSLVAAIILHIVWLMVCSLVESSIGWKFKPSYHHILYLLYGDLSSGGVYKETLDLLADRRVYLVSYFLSLYMFSYAIARLLLRGVRWFHLDHSIMGLRLKDEWFYFLRGEMFSFSEFKNSVELKYPISGTYVSLVISLEDGDYLYKGFLWDFFLDKKGNLDRIVLYNVIRSKFEPGEQDRKRQEQVVEEDSILIYSKPWAFQQVSSQVFTVRYDECRTLACTYFYIRKV